MPFTPEELQEIREALGIPEGKSITDVLGEATSEQINKTLNAYDKRKGAELEKLTGSLKLPDELMEKINKIVADKESNDDADKDKDSPPDMAKLPPAVREILENQEKANKALAKRLDEAEKARQEADEKVEKERLAGRARAMSDAIAAAATAKEIGGLDASRVDVLLPYLKSKDMVREVEGKDGAYEMFTGEEDPIHGDKIYLPLGEAMKKFATTDIGKTFRPPMRGQGGDLPGDDNRDREPQGDLVKVESLGGDAKKIRDYADKGLIDAS